jgi:pyruvate kinase
MSSANDIVIVSALRTAVGNFSGAFGALHAQKLGEVVLRETLAKTGTPSRSEITDAAMGERAECVMLNKGPYALRAARTLDDILRRMEAHQEKKGSLLRRLGVATGFESGLER